MGRNSPKPWTSPYAMACKSVMVEILPPRFRLGNISSAKKIVATFIDAFLFGH
jgi:hypothetical protein